MQRFTIPQAILVLSVLLVTVPAYATSYEEAQVLYASGDYDAAADMGEALKTPQGYTLATKALLGKTNLLPRKERSLDDIARANALAEAAFEMDPDNIDAHLQYATSLGIRGRLISKFRAKLERLPERAEEHLAIARKLQPDHAWANAFYAAWHLEVTRNGGATLAKAMYGATREQGIEIYDRALTLQPMSPVLPYEYAQFLLAADYFTYKDKAAELLEMSRSLPAKNHQERAVHGRVEALQAGLEADDPKRVLGLITTHLGTKKIRVPKRPRE